MGRNRLAVQDINRDIDQLVDSNPEELLQLPPPFDTQDEEADGLRLTPDQRQKYDVSLDGYLALALERPKSKTEEELLV